MNKYVLGIDQSTQGTKGLLFDEKGALVCRADLPHKQYIDERGWVEHDPEEIYANTLQVVKNLIEKAGINKKEISVLGISNQRETALVWDRKTGKPVYNAVVWQCARGSEICKKIAAEHENAEVQKIPEGSAQALRPTPADIYSGLPFHLSEDEDPVR